MALQDDRAIAMFLHLREADPLGRTEDLRMVLQDHTIVDHRYRRVRTVATILLEGRGGVDNVVNVPLARFAHRVGQWDRLLVDTTRLSVHVGRVVVAIEDLNLIHALQEDTAITTQLALARDVGRYHPFDVQLEVVEFLFGLDVSFRFIDGKYAIMYVPLGWAALDALPSGEILAIEQDDRVGRSREASTFQFRSWCDYFRNGLIEFRHLVSDSGITGLRVSDRATGAYKRADRQ